MKKKRIIGYGLIYFNKNKKINLKTDNMKENKTIVEIADEIRLLHQKNDKKDLQKKIDLCFELMELFCETQEKEKILCEITSILGATIKKGLGIRFLNFSEKFKNQLPPKVEYDLLKKVLKMEGVKKA